MIEMATMVINIVTAILFVTCILYWFKIGRRLSKVVANVEKNIDPGKINRSDLDKSENLHSHKKWPDEHID